VSDLFHGRAAKAALVSVKVPVIYDREVRYVLSAGIAPDRLNTLLAHQNLPADWIASIFDASHTIVGRSRTPERYIGQRASADLTEAMAREKSGIVKSRTLDGQPVYAAFSRSEISSWSVAIGVPTAMVTDRLYLFLSLGAAGGFVVLVAGIGLAVHHAKTIAAGVRSLAGDAGELPGADGSAAPPSDIREIDEAARRIEAAAITLQRRTHERDLAERDKDVAEKTAQLKDEFIATVSHELRTPLTAIRGYASSLMQPDVTWDRGSQDRFLDRIAAESARLGRLVDDLLDFSTIESGLMRLQPDWCDIPLVLQAAIACLPQAGTAAVSVQCDPGLPPVWADHDRLEQVFVNLVNNAVGHNPPGTGVRVTAGSVTPSEVVISVTDDGTGIPDELAVAPFEAGRRRRTRTGGAGLGLSIAHGIVQAHGGRIELERLPRGTRFRVFLPVEATEHPAEAGEHPAGVTGVTGVAMPRAGLTNVAALVPGGAAQGGNHRG
jgi:signal transduction histidine kinase